MQWLRNALDGWGDILKARALRSGGWLVAIILGTVFLGVLYIIGLGLLATAKEIKEAANKPDIPAFLADHKDRGPGLDRGDLFGATPSKVLPRPTSYFLDNGVDYTFRGSPNWSQRGIGSAIEAIVIHVTGPGTMEGMAAWFSNPASQVSAHFGVGKVGEVHQYVEIGDAAWHAGVCNRWTAEADRWCGSSLNPNRYVVGIELLLQPGENLSDYPAMEQSFYLLMDWLLDTTNLEASTTSIMGHYQIDSVNRSIDPICCVELNTVIATLSMPTEWSGCAGWGGRYNFSLDVWMHQNTGFFDPSRGQWFVAPAC